VSTGTLNVYYFFEEIFYFFLCSSLNLDVGHLNSNLAAIPAMQPRSQCCGNYGAEPGCVVNDVLNTTQQELRVLLLLLLTLQLLLQLARVPHITRPTQYFCEPLVASVLLV